MRAAALCTPAICVRSKTLLFFRFVRELKRLKGFCVVFLKQLFSGPSPLMGITVANTTARLPTLISKSTPHGVRATD